MSHPLENLAGGILKPIKNGRLLRAFDIENIGVTVLRQSQLFYFSTILSRLIAGTMRSWKTKSFNEPREHFLRDMSSFLMFYFAVPITSRIFISRSKYRDELFKAPSLKKDGLWTFLKGYISGPVPTIQQLKDRERQALQIAKESISDPTALNALECKTVKHYQNLKNFHNGATIIGLISVFALLGVGVNLLNIYLTRKNVAQRKLLEAPTLQPAQAPSQGLQNWLEPSSTRSAFTPRTKNYFALNPSYLTAAYRHQKNLGALYASPSRFGVGL